MVTLYRKEILNSHYLYKSAEESSNAKRLLHCFKDLDAYSGGTAIGWDPLKMVPSSAEDRVCKLTAASDDSLLKSGTTWFSHQISSVRWQVVLDTLLTNLKLILQ